MAFLEAIETLAPVHLHFDDESEGGFLDIGALIREHPKTRTSIAAARRR